MKTYIERAEKLKEWYERIDTYGKENNYNLELEEELENIKQKAKDLIKEINECLILLNTKQNKELILDCKKAIKICEEILE